MKPKALLLDAVGTLIHPRESVGTVYARAAAGFGASLDPAATDRAFRQAFGKAVPPPPRDHPAPDDEKGWWRDLVMSVFDQFEPGRNASFHREGCFEHLYCQYARGECWSVYPEVPAFLTRCRASELRLAVVSNFDRRLYRILRELKLDTAFDAVVISSEVGASKPARRVFEAALRALGCAAEETIHIGDDPRADWQGARAAGLGTFELDRKSDTLDTFWEALEQESSGAN